MRIWHGLVPRPPEHKGIEAIAQNQELIVRRPACIHGNTLIECLASFPAPSLHAWELGTRLIECSACTLSLCDVYPNYCPPSLHWHPSIQLTVSKTRLWWTPVNEVEGCLQISDAWSTYNYEQLTESNTLRGRLYNHERLIQTYYKMIDWCLSENVRYISDHQIQVNVSEWLTYRSIWQSQMQGGTGYVTIWLMIQTYVKDALCLSERMCDNVIVRLSLISSSGRRIGSNTLRD